MKKELEFLYELEDALKLGMLASESIQDQINNNELKELVKKHHEEYSKMLGEVGYYLVEHDSRIKKESKVINTVFNSMTKLKTLFIKDDSQIAEMFIEGSNMGIIEMTRLINRYQHKINEQIIMLGKKIVSIEQANIESMKQYL